jgi:hypothetical protein
MDLRTLQCVIAFAAIKRGGHRQFDKNAASTVSAVPLLAGASDVVDQVWLGASNRACDKGLPQDSRARVRD